MCYSAQVWTAYDAYIKVHGADIDIRTFAELYGFRNEVGPTKVKIPKGIDFNFARATGGPEAEVRALIEDFNRANQAKWGAELFKQRKRLADAERLIAAGKGTKKADNDVRIATSKVDQLKGWMAAGSRTEPKPTDGRIWPNHYAPVMIWEGGRRVVKPMRYLLRRPGRPESEDIKFPGCYNARRDNLERFWRGQFGVTQGVIVVERFYENVSRHAMEGRELRPDEHEENVILEFVPRPAEPMIIACLWAHWSGAGERDLLSFAAITDEPPPEVAAAGHDRCIVQIKPENVDEWLQPGGNLKRMHEILDDRPRPYYEHRLAA